MVEFNWKKFIVGFILISIVVDLILVFMIAQTSHLLSGPERVLRTDIFQSLYESLI